MSTRDLHSKIFTFDKKMATKDLTKMVGAGNTKNIDVIIKNLPSMKNIDEEFIPKFKFIQIKKSYIKSHDGKVDRIMLCFIDISQKILYDTSKAEGEFLTLINSTISHEMRNPLNSIINQCKIIFVICQ
jgi:signal transduction histidine kinase